jgi:hypothetical protein
MVAAWTIGMGRLNKARSAMRPARYSRQSRVKIRVWFITNDNILPPYRFWILDLRLDEKGNLLIDGKT